MTTRSVTSADRRHSALLLHAHEVSTMSGHSALLLHAQESVQHFSSATALGRESHHLFRAVDILGMEIALEKHVLGFFHLDHPHLKTVMLLNQVKQALQSC